MKALDFMIRHATGIMLCTNRPGGRVNDGQSICGNVLNGGRVGKSLKSSSHARSPAARHELAGAGCGGKIDETEG
jgi:hypothetical protein